MNPAKTIGIVGGGNMGGALAGGLLAGGWTVAVAEKMPAGRERISRDFPAATTVETAADFPFAPDLLVLAVKPNQLRECCDALRTGGISPQTTVASVAAGARWRTVSEWLGGFPHLARAMPNTPALIGLGMTACFAPSSLGAARRDLATRALEAVGAVEWVENEAALEAMTALSGCGPAYGYLLAEAMAAGGARMGLDADLTRRATAQTLRGAAEMLTRDGANPADLRRAVTSPGGATAAALKALADADFNQHIENAMRAARKRAEEIGDALEKN